MTCIVGIKHNKKIYLGGDSAMTNQVGQQSLSAESKVFTNGKVAFGICGSPKLMNPLRLMKIPSRKLGQDVREFVAKFLVPAIETALKEGGCVTESPEHGSIFEGAILIGFAGILYRMESNFQLISDAHGFDSIGSGADIAVGSLHATKRGMKPRPRILAALEAAAIGNSGVRPPFTIVVV